jgi:hypothetical protein
MLPLPVPASMTVEPGLTPSFMVIYAISAT